MKNFFTLLSILAASLTLQADEFEGGAEELKVNSAKVIQMKVSESAKLACQGDACVLFAVDSSGEEFKVEFTVGYGDPNGSNANGSVIVVGQDPAVNDPQPFASLKVSYTQFSCTQKVVVPESLYVAMNTYIYGLLNEDGTTKKNFAPADQTMILFYTTIAQQAKGCSNK